MQFKMATTTAIVLLSAAACATKQPPGALPQPPPKQMLCDAITEGQWFSETSVRSLARSFGGTLVRQKNEVGFPLGHIEDAFAPTHSTLFVVTIQSKPPEQISFIAADRIVWSPQCRTATSNVDNHAPDTGTTIE